MPSYHSFVCPNCENHFRVIWPEPLPSHFHRNSKIKLECPECGELTELYAFLVDKILCAPEPGIPTVQVEAISPRDLNPKPDARMEWNREIFVRRAARFKAMYGN
jgi:hypothetical protein